METLPLHSTLASLPTSWQGEPLLQIRKALRQQETKLVVLDDDPTGTQTVEDIPVVTSWDKDTLADVFDTPGHGFFILTNSRALSVKATTELHRELLNNLKAAANGKPFTVVSRSDSTLRGHFLVETEVITECCGPYDLTVVAPFFEAGGRLTINDTHYVIQDDQLIPAHLTPFASDKVFGFSHSYLPDWIEEKTEGKVKADQVVSIDLDTIRKEGPKGILPLLRYAKRGSICVVNACAQSDMEAFAAAALEMEETGCRILYRTAAAFVAARLGIRPPPPLLPEFISSKSDRGGLIVVGSYVPKTTEQLSKLQELKALHPIELKVNELLECEDRGPFLESLTRQLNEALKQGHDVLLFTSRDLIFSKQAEDNLKIGDTVAKALVSIVSGIEEAPGFVIAKGGITSSTIATDALGIQKAMILGQIVPGVPVWRSKSESKFPELDLVIFPGNVGGPDSLALAYQKIKRH